MAAVGVAALMIGCSGPDPASQLEQPDLDQALSAYSLDLSAAEQSAAELGWQAPPADCPHAYRMSSTYEPAMRFEDDNDSHLIVGAHARQQPDYEPRPGPIPEGGMAPLQLYYKGLRAERKGAVRDVYITREFAGPAAPTAACMPQTWDPMEDALALAWPRLTGRLTAVGERWTGLLVGGKCSRSPCVDPKTGGGGEDSHELVCVSPPWKQRLAGLFEHDGELYAWVHGSWTDGHASGEGITTESRTLISVEHGRPVWSQTRVDHRFGQPAKGGGFSPVVRTWTLESIDTCPGSLAAAGWERPAEHAETEEFLRDRLAHADELRRTKGTPTFAKQPGDAP